MEEIQNQIRIRDTYVVSGDPPWVAVLDQMIDIDGIMV